MATKIRVSKQQIIAHRNKSSRDNSPRWEGCEAWSSAEFHKNFCKAMDYYRLDSEIKTFKPILLKWMSSAGLPTSLITAVKSIKDSRINTTMGAIAHCLLKGMPEQRLDFNNGKNSAEWLKNSIYEVVETGKYDKEEDQHEEKVLIKAPAQVVSIQERVRDSALAMTEEIENEIEAWHSNPDIFDSKPFKVVNLLKGKGAKSAHARIIKEFYQRTLIELEQVCGNSADDQLKEGYRHRSKKQIKSLLAFYQDVDSACDMLIQEAKVNKKPRVKKSVPKDKLVEKLKFLKTFEPLKLVSINPVDIIGSKELYCYDTKSRKIFKYVADELIGPLGIKGTTITGFNVQKSTGKTLRKPADQLAEFKKAGKVALRTYMDTINTTEIKATGRINEHQILLKTII